MENITQNEHNSLQTNNETIEIAKQIILLLNENSEVLQNNNNKLNESKYHVNKANRIEKGMSWLGWLYNLISFSLGLYKLQHMGCCVIYNFLFSLALPKA